MQYGVPENLSFRGRPGDSARRGTPRLPNRGVGMFPGSSHGFGVARATGGKCSKEGYDPAGQGGTTAKVQSEGVKVTKKEETSVSSEPKVKGESIVSEDTLRVKRYNRLLKFIV